MTRRSATRKRARRDESGFPAGRAHAAIGMAADSRTGAGWWCPAITRPPAAGWPRYGYAVAAGISAFAVHAVVGDALVTRTGLKVPAPTCSVKGGATPTLRWRRLASRVVVEVQSGRGRRRRRAPGHRPSGNGFVNSPGAWVM